jgi:hypothetical protein
MDLVYLDYNCFQRPFDYPHHVRIQMEALACQEIFSRAQRNQVQLVWTFVHEDEVLLCPYPVRKREVMDMAELCDLRLGPEKPLRQIARLFQQKVHLTARDAFHLACADYLNADFFPTCWVAKLTSDPFSSVLRTLAY